ncbi:SGNH/GDSL hydrolase family protein [Flavobacterium sp.]|uniref:SGNH/GDSL hydrolase family protein n=1 Tax=Flavobacterium sp. TaxID=239 RepID=UPI00286A4451|nr:SGNH/GDSL hydrolase family protein [Flavobacterium sp.]
MIKNFKWLLLVSLTFIACDKSDEVTNYNSSDGLPLTAGEADFSNYVSLGNSLCAGYSDGALFIKGQQGSYPNILSQQFALVGGGEFKIPYMNDNLGGFSAGGAQFSATPVRFYLNGCTLPELVPGISGTQLGVSIAANGPYNNTGVPGAKCIHLVTPGYAGASPYFGRIATSATQTVLEYATAQSPTFFSLWIGSNDVLGYALSGGDGTNPITPSAGSVGVGFDSSYAAIVDGLTANGAKGVVANIPFVSTIPFFTTIPVKPLAPNLIYVGANLPDANETDCKVVYPVSVNDIAVINNLNTNLIGVLRQLLTPFGQADRVQFYSTTEANPLLITDESLDDMGANITFAAQNSGNPQLVALAPFLGATYGKARHSKAGDLILLTTKAAIGSTVPLPASLASFSVRGITYPMEDKYVLLPSEITELNTATTAYNITIKSQADSHNLAFVDANDILTKINSGGIVADSFTLTSAFVSGGVFSLDGVHPSPRGYAFIANKFLEKINEKYHSNLKGVNVGSYPILYPYNLP